MQNEFNGSEKRKFERHVFSSKDEVVGFFKSPKIADDLLSCKIADISAGGLRFFLSRSDNHLIGVGDTFILKKIMGKLKLAFITDIELKIQWVVDHELFGHIVIGGQFISISESDQASIDRFVRYETMGQSLDD